MNGIKTVSFILFSIFILFLFNACNKFDSIEPPGDPTNEDEQHSITVRSGTTPATESSYPHFSFIWKGDATESNANAIAYSGAIGLTNLPTHSLMRGDYLLTLIAISDSSAVTIHPTLPQTNGALTESLITRQTLITLKENHPVPDILIGSKTLSVSTSSTATVDLSRFVCRIKLSIAGIPSTPEVKSVQIEVDELYNQVSLDGTLSSSISPTVGSSRAFALTYNSSNGNYSTENLSFPSLATKTTIPMALTITYMDNSSKTIRANAPGRLDSNNEITLNTTYEEVSRAITLGATYQAWTINSTPITTTFTESPEEGEEDPVGGGEEGEGSGEVDPTPIGTITSGGVVFSTGKVVALVENSGSEFWSGSSTDIGMNSPDGSVNYSIFENWAIASGTPDTKWNTHQTMKYVKSLRSEGNEWYLPSKEEWSEIATHFSTINTAIQTYINEGGSANLIQSGTTYWSSTESSASAVYICNPSTGAITTVNKSSEKRIRVIKKLNP
ncbi:MAG: hypothetical protein ACK5JU_04535 [Bacteroidales bacterium]